MVVNDESPGFHRRREGIPKKKKRLCMEVAQPVFHEIEREEHENEQDALSAGEAAVPLTGKSVELSMGLNKFVPVRALTFPANGQ